MRNEKKLIRKCITWEFLIKEIILSGVGSVLKHINEKVSAFMLVIVKIIYNYEWLWMRLIMNKTSIEIS